jgi:hypothetical protein
MFGDDVTAAIFIKLRAPSTAKYLQDIQNPQVNKRAFLCVIDLCTLGE